MTTPTLSDQLRAVVDAVDTPTLAEIRMHASSSSSAPSRSPRRRVAVALAAVLLVVAIGAGIVALLDRSDPPSRPAATEPPADCVVTETALDGCAMTAEDASRYLGFTVHEPTDLPDGWVPLVARLRVVDGEPLYARAWGPAGTDVATVDDCTPRLVVRERRALPGEDPAKIGSPYPLGNGTIAYGEAPDTGCYSGELAWVRDGRSIVVAATNMTLEGLTAVARSLDR